MKNYLFAILFLNSCFFLTKKNTSENSSEIISLQKTACFGTCPIFKVTIYDDGKTFYFGEKFVKKIGRYNFTLSKKEINSILKKANDINFYDLKNEYSENISDLPSTFTKIKDKKIRNHIGAPQKLRELEQIIEDIVLKKLEIKSF